MIEFDIRNGILYSVTLDGQQNISLPENVEAIWFDAFSGCSNVATITVNDGVKYIKGGAFLECTSLKQVYLPESVSKIHVFNDQYIADCSLANCKGGFSEFRNAADGFKVICKKDSLAEKYCTHFSIPFDIL